MMLNVSPKFVRLCSLSFLALVIIGRLYATNIASGNLYDVRPTATQAQFNIGDAAELKKSLDRLEFQGMINRDTCQWLILVNYGTDVLFLVGIAVAIWPHVLSRGHAGSAVEIQDKSHTPTIAPEVPSDSEH
jgi:hypothetical protein